MCVCKREIRVCCCEDLEWREKNWIKLAERVGERSRSVAVIWWRGLDSSMGRRGGPNLGLRLCIILGNGMDFGLLGYLESRQVRYGLC